MCVCVGGGGGGEFIHLGESAGLGVGGQEFNVASRWELLVMGGLRGGGVEGGDGRKFPAGGTGRGRGRAGVGRDSGILVSYAGQQRSVPGSSIKEFG